MHKKDYIIFILLFLFLIFKTYWNHKPYDLGNWQHELWADRSGYYIYLPATFIYGFDGQKMPKDIDINTGNGFSIDKDSGKIQTKYPAGVAILQSPFYGMAHLITKTFKIDRHGFDHPYLFFMYIGASFYLTIGFLLLFLLLKKRFSKWISYLTIFLIFVGTNLFYYAVDEILMSHIYSFFLFATMIWLWEKILISKTKNIRLNVFLGIILALIILVRPTNAAFIIFTLFFWNINSLTSFKARIKLILQPRFIITTTLIGAIVLSSQLAYWHYLTGKFVYYSYSEGFNWLSPQIKEIFLSTNNGLLLYSPLYTVLILSTILSAIRKELNSFLILGIFLVMTYIFASWDCWYFGCSFGQRSFIEYSLLLAFPFASLNSKILKTNNLKSIIKAVSYGLPILYMSLFSILMSNSYIGCFFGETWDWNEYKRVLHNKNIPLLHFNTFKYKTDFEATHYSNYLLNTHMISHHQEAHSGNNVCIMDSTNSYSFAFSRELRAYSLDSTFKVETSLWYRIEEINNSNQLHLVVQVVGMNERTVYWKSIPFKQNEINNWQQINAVCNIPKFPLHFSLRVFVWNQGSRCLLDDFEIKIKKT